MPNARILIVEDDRVVAELIQEILQTLGYVVPAIASSKETAIQQVRDIRPDLVLMDIELNGKLEGIEAAEQIQRHDDIPVVYLTAHTDEETLQRAKITEPFGYILKPFTARELHTNLEIALYKYHVEKQLRESRRRYHEELEEQVKARTRELAQANEHLQQEIIERTKTEEALAQERNLLRTLIDNSVDYIYVKDTESRFLTANKAVVRAMGVATLEELVGKTDFDFPPVKLAKRYYTDEQAVIKSGQPLINREEPVINQETGDTLWYLTTKIPFRDSQGNIAGIVGISRDITERKRHEFQLEQEREQLRQENIALKTSVKDRYRFSDIIGKSSAMQDIYELILQAATSDANVVITGESGTGKELIAWTIYALSKRKDKAFVPVNCGAITETLFESEFFGHQKGAFTGAYKDTQGFFDYAHEGTLFLDEIGELSPVLQVKLLRALEGGGHTPVGGHTVKKVDVRIIAATNRDLTAMVKQGAMRKDFFFRIDVITITVPPLREHREDIPLLIDHFWERYREGKSTLRLPGRVLEQLYTYDWPGNVRELQNVLQRYLTTQRLDFADFGETPQEVRGAMADIEVPSEGLILNEVISQFEKRYITNILERNHGHRGKTAQTLGITRRSLHRKIKAYQILPSYAKP